MSIEQSTKVMNFPQNSKPNLKSARLLSKGLWWSPIIKKTKTKKLVLLLQAEAD
jgi:hypothetical protein